MTVTSKTAEIPTGRVELLDGTKVIASGPLAKGSAKLKANLSAGGKVTLVAHYLGDAHHLPGNSAELKVAPIKTAPCEVK